MSNHNAPPVVYPLGRSLFATGFLVCLWLAGVLSLALWFASASRIDWRLGMLCIAVGVGTAGLVISWRAMPAGSQLVWDGQSWCWKSAGYQAGIAEQQLSVMVDLQQMMLLRIENKARASMWLWAQKSAMPGRWLDFRRAVYSPVRPVKSFPAGSRGFASSAEL